MPSVLDGIAREGSQQMLTAAWKPTYTEAHADERGRRLVVRNGHAEPRSITTTAGSQWRWRLTRVDDRRVDDVAGERCLFRNSIIPPSCRKSRKVTEVLPLVYLDGMSTGDFVPALEESSAPRPGRRAR